MSRAEQSFQWHWKHGCLGSIKKSQKKPLPTVHSTWPDSEHIIVWRSWWFVCVQKSFVDQVLYHSFSATTILVFQVLQCVGYVSSNMFWVWSTSMNNDVYIIQVLHGINYTFIFGKWKVYSLLVWSVLFTLEILSYWHYRLSSDMKKGSTVVLIT